MHQSTGETLKRVVATLVYIALMFFAVRAQSYKWCFILTLVYAILVSPSFAKLWGNFISRVVLTILYVLMLPFGLGVRSFSDPLKIRGVVSPGSLWIPRKFKEDRLEDARRQG